MEKNIWKLSTLEGFVSWLVVISVEVLQQRGEVKAELVLDMARGPIDDEITMQ